MNQYTVQPGDTLSLIAGRLGISPWQNILQYNPQFAANPDLIQVGDTVNYPTAPGSAPSPTPTDPAATDTTATGLSSTVYLYGAAIAIVAGALLFFPKPKAKKRRR